jgi:hypothetical protein
MQRCLPVCFLIISPNSYRILHKIQDILSKVSANGDSALRDLLAIEQDRKIKRG